MYRIENLHKENQRLSFKLLPVRLDSSLNDRREINYLKERERQGSIIKKKNTYKSRTIMCRFMKLSRRIIRVVDKTIFSRTNVFIALIAKLSRGLSLPWH